MQLSCENPSRENIKFTFLYWEYSLFVLYFSTAESHSPAFSVSPTSPRQFSHMLVLFGIICTQPTVENQFTITYMYVNYDLTCGDKICSNVLWMMFLLVIVSAQISGWLMINAAAFIVDRWWQLGTQENQQCPHSECSGFASLQKLCALCAVVFGGSRENNNPHPPPNNSSKSQS